MPLPVTLWTATTPIDSKSLNLALYTVDGTLGKPNGILFHALRPMTAEVLNNVQTLTTSTGGTRSELDQSGSSKWNAIQVIDNAGYYGQTSDGTYPACAYHLIPVIAGSTGDGVTAGGWTILCHFVPVTSPSTQTSCGASLDNNGSFVVNGTRQRPVTAATNDSIPFVLDLQDITGGKFQPSVFVADSASASCATVVNATDSSGLTSHFWTIWAGVRNSQAASYGTPAIPAPFTGYTAAATVGTSGASTVNVNSTAGIAGPMGFLSNPPLFRSHLGSSQSIPNGTSTAVTLGGSADVDNYSGWTASTYTVQRAGLYLCHALIPYSASTAGHRRAGIAVNGTIYWGPGQQNTAALGCYTAKTQVFSLQAGDTVQAYTSQDSGGSLALLNTEQTRLFMCWLGLEGVPSTLWTPPDTSFRWKSGTTGDQLPALFQQHLGNDIGFLVNRPYLLAYQTAAQSGFGNNVTFNLVTMDTVAGQVHSDNGDNYSGWNAGSSKYAAQAAGWYLAVAEMFATSPTTTTNCAITAGFQVSGSGGRAPSNANDWYQRMFASVSGIPPGATAAGLYYLNVGETIQPMLRTDSYTSTTWGTQVTTSTNSHFECVWISS
jgi:hypothetical protein